jgi:hypothetical protein
MKPLAIIVPISLMLFSCGISSRMIPSIVPLSKNQYKIKITEKNSTGKPTQEMDSLFKKKADQTCKNYKIVSIDSETTPDRRSITKTWIIECPEEKMTEEQKKAALTQPKEGWSFWDGLAILVRSYEIASKCREYGNGPAEGSKLVYVWIVVRNISKDVVKLPSFLVELEGIKEPSKSFGGSVCRYDKKALGNACWNWHGNLDPGVMCEGWELFEVPEKMRVEGRYVKVSVHLLEEKIQEVGKWRLEGK